MRIAHSFRNIGVTFIGQLLAMVIAFPARLIFLNNLGTENLGLHSLFTNLITLLSLVDLGIGSAIVFSLYKPIADGNTSKVKGMMQLYRKIYTVIGISVFIIGISIMLFLETIVKNYNGTENIYLVFLLFILNTTISYFFVYKKSIIIAHQKNYIVNSIHYLYVVLTNLFQIYLLVTYQNFTIYLIAQIIFTVFENLTISYFANKMFPYLKTYNSEVADKQVIKELFNNIKAVMMHKIGSVIMLGTDNVIISMFLGVYWVGIYSNYLLVINAITSILNQVFNSIMASVGNVLIEDSNEKSYRIFNYIFLMNFWIISISSLGIWFVINPFLELWIGGKFILDFAFVSIIAINFYVFNMRSCSLLFKNAAGLFRPDRYKPLIESFLNLVLSIILVTNFGISGVILATLLSVLLTSFWIEPWIVYKSVFKKSVREYFKTYMKYTFIFINSFLIILFMQKNIKVESSYINILLLIFYCVMVPSSLIVLFFRRTLPFKDVLNIVIKVKRGGRNEKNIFSSKKHI